MTTQEIDELEKRILKLCRKHADISNLCQDVILLIEAYKKPPEQPKRKTTTKAKRKA